MPPKKKPLTYMEKRIPTNPRYKNVQPMIDTGASVSKYQKKLDELRENYKFRNDELFKRMKISTLVQLILQVEEINRSNMKVMENFDTPRAHGAGDDNGTIGGYSSDEDINNHVTQNDNKVNNEDDYYANNDNTESLRQQNVSTVRGTNMDTQRSTLQSVISGMGEVDIRKDFNGEGELAPTNPFPDNLPYLLLDVREREEYDKCHIIKACNFPHTMLCRSQNYESKEMLACRNVPGKIIIIYDGDERLAPNVAHTLFQRGYDNLFMLSGGLKVALMKFPNGLVTGPVPDDLKVAIKKFLNTSGATARRSQMSKASTNTNSNPLTVRTDDNTLEDGTLKTFFTENDIDQLSNQLDVLLDGNSTVASTIRGPTIKASSVISDKSNSTISGRKPFIP